MLALTLFNLKPHLSVADYRDYSNRRLKSGMATLPSVIRFSDAEIVGSMARTDREWQLAEIIEISSAQEFEEDHTEGRPGHPVAAEWADWVESYRVFYLETIEP